MDEEDAIKRARHIAVLFPDFSSGGCERIALRLADAWAARGRRVTLLCGSERGPARSMVEPGIAVIAPRSEITGGAFYRTRLAVAFARSVAEISPDVVFGIGNFHLPILALMRRRLPPGGARLVCKLSNPLRKPGWDPVSNAFFATVARLASPGVDGLVAMSEQLRREACELLERSDVACIPEPNLPDGYAATRAAGSPEAPPLIVCAGRLERQKRLDLALRAFALMRRDREVRLVILGEGSRRRALEREARRLGIGAYVEFAGYVPDVQPYLAKASMLLCTSSYEGYPAALVEAIAAGVKVVTTPCSPAIEEIMFDPSFGRIAEPQAVDLARAAAAVLDAPDLDPVARDRLIARHQTSGAAEHYLALFDSIMA